VLVDFLFFPQNETVKQLVVFYGLEWSGNADQLQNRKSSWFHEERKLSEQNQASKYPNKILPWSTV